MRNGSDPAASHKLVETGPNQTETNMTNLNPTADNIAGIFARPLFDPQEFAAEQFLSGFQADVQSLTWCIKNALMKHAGIDCTEAPFSFGDYGIEPVQRWGWTIIDLHLADNRMANFVVSATERDGIRLYTIETNRGTLEDLPLADNAGMIFDFLMQHLLPRLS